MFNRRTPIYLQHSPAPSVRGFALLAGCEAGVRGMLIGVMPLVIYRAYEDAALVSTLYFFVGAISMVVLFAVLLTRRSRADLSVGPDSIGRVFAAIVTGGAVVGRHGHGLIPGAPVA